MVTLLLTSPNDDIYAVTTLLSSFIEDENELVARALSELNRPGHTVTDATVEPMTKDTLRARIGINEFSY